MHNDQADARPPNPHDRKATPIMAAAHQLAPLLYTVNEALAMLRMSRTQFYAQVNAGRLHIVKQGTATRVTADELAAYVALLKAEAKDAR